MPRAGKVTITRLSKLSVNVFLPALVVSSLAKGLNPALLRSAWSLPLIAMADIALAAGVVTLVIRWMKPPGHLRRPWIAAMVFQNSSALPLMIGKALSQQAPFKSDPSAFEKYTIAVFIYNIGWQLTFWTVGFQYITTVDRPELSPAATVAVANQSWFSVAGHNLKLGCTRLFQSPVVLACFTGLVVGLIPPVQRAMFGSGGWLRFIGTTLETLGGAAVPVVTLVVSATLGKAILRMSDVHVAEVAAPARSLKPATAGDDPELTMGLVVPDFGDEEFEDNQDWADSSPGSAGLRLGGRSRPALRSDSDSGDDPGVVGGVALHGSGAGRRAKGPVPEALTPLPARSVLVTLGMIRLGLIGVIQFVVTAFVFLPTLVPGAGSMMKLVLLIECCVPSANMVIVACQQAGLQRAAEDLSAAYVVMYGFMFVGLLFYVMAAIAIIGDFGRWHMKLYIDPRNRLYANIYHSPALVWALGACLNAFIRRRACNNGECAAK